MTDPDAGGFKALSGAEALDRLARLSPRKRRTTARTLIYKKGLRPTKMHDQITLLDALRDEPALTDFDRFYALIAGAHKVCEEVMTDAAVYWLDRLLKTEPQIRAMPIAYGLRKDRTHLVFSALNVALNLDILTGSRHTDQLADWFFHEVETLNLRRMTPYLFNSTSNTVKCAGLVILARTDKITSTASLMRRLVSYSIEINNPSYWWVFSRFLAPARLRDVSERAAFGSHCNTIMRLRAIEDAATATDAMARLASLKRTAELCVAQANPRQKTALLDAVHGVLG